MRVPPHSYSHKPNRLTFRYTVQSLVLNNVSAYRLEKEITERDGTVHFGSGVAQVNVHGHRLVQQIFCNSTEVNHERVHFKAHLVKVVTLLRLKIRKKKIEDDFL